METTDAVTGGVAGVGLGPVLDSIRTQMEALRANIDRRLTEAGIDTTSIQDYGQLAKVLKDNGYTNIARLIAAILLAKILVVREFGRYTGGDKFTEVIQDELKDFPNLPSLQDLDNILTAIETGSSSSSSSTTTEITEILPEEETEETE